MNKNKLTSSEAYLIVIEAELCDMCTECVEIHDELDEPE